MFRRKSLVPLSWLPLLGLALVISLGGCQGQVTMEGAADVAGEVADKVVAKVTAESRSVQIGERFPNIDLKDQDGKPFALKETLAKGPVVLVVYRSADW